MVQIHFLDVLSVTASDRPIWWLQIGTLRPGGQQMTKLLDSIRWHTKSWVFFRPDTRGGLGEEPVLAWNLQPDPLSPVYNQWSVQRLHLSSKCVLIRSPSFGVTINLHIMSTFNFFWSCLNAKLKALLKIVCTHFLAPADLKKKVIHAFITSRLDSLHSGISQRNLQRLQSIQNAAARLLIDTKRPCHTSPSLLTPVLELIWWLYCSFLKLWMGMLTLTVYLLTPSEPDILQGPP